MTSITTPWGSLVLRDPWARDARHVALCGHPKSGKSEVARILEDDFGGVVVDDGLILRRAAPILLGFDPDLPFTQEGKATTIRAGDRVEQVRHSLGELGNYLEARYGEDIMPLRAMQMANEEHAEANFWIYPSVRKGQGRCYKRHGGVVVQVNRPGFGPSGNAFDVWDESAVDIVIENDGSLDDLRERIHALPSFLKARYG
jgi:hypothetical protein